MVRISLLILIIISQSVDAFEDHQRNILPGNRSAAMGGAYTAISDDPSGAIYNPAGLAFAKEDQISLTVNSYSNHRTIYRKTIGDEPYEVESFSIIPGFLGGVHRLGKLVLSWSYLTKDVKNIDQNDNFYDIEDFQNLSSFTIQHLESNNFLWGGGSGAISLGSALSIGASLFYYQREIKSLEHQLAQYNNDSFKITNYRVNAKNSGTILITGIQLRLKRFALGVSGLTATSLSNKGRIYSDTTERVGGLETDLAIAETETDIFEEKIPPTYRLGISCTPAKPIILAVDIIFHHASTLRAVTNVDYDLVDGYNYSMGIELLLSPLVVRAGGFTNNSLTPKIDPNRSSQPNHIDYYGLSFGFGIKFKGYETDLTFIRQIGKGEGQIISNSKSIQTIDAVIDTATISIITYN